MKDRLSIPLQRVPFNGWYRLYEPSPIRYPIKSLLYMTYGEGCSVVTFPNEELASEWLSATKDLKERMDVIVEQSQSEDEGIPKVVEWHHYYVNRYLTRWGSNLVAPDVRRGAEKSNADIPEEHRINIPTDVIGTVKDGCTFRCRDHAD